MAYFFTLLLLASIIFLIIGFINPARALFWSGGERTKKKSLRLYGPVALASLVGLALTVPDVKKEEKEQPAATTGTGVANPKDTVASAHSPAGKSSVMTSYNLPNSDYSFPVTVSGIEKKLMKDGVKMPEEDKYVVAGKKDGYEISFTFSMSNPYEKEMICPVPYKFYLASPEKDFIASSTTSNKACECEVNSTNHVTTADGRDMEDIPNIYGCIGIGTFCLKYQPGETRSFRVKFFSPVLTTQETLLLWGFDRTESAGRKMPYDKCWVIDVASGTFTGEVLYK